MILNVRNSLGGYIFNVGNTFYLEEIKKNSRIRWKQYE